MDFSESQGKTKILLESGTNELELMEFVIAGETFGINVAKVKEIMMIDEVKKMPNSHEMVEGIFKPRDEIITIIDLAKYLGLERENTEKAIFIATHFNKLNFAFRVDSVIGIARVSWQDIKKPNRVIYGGDEGAATGIADFNKRLITILDFEKIVAEVSPESSIQYESIEKMGKRTESTKPILVAEDSMLLAKLIIDCLHGAGYKNVIRTDNGQEAWSYIQDATSSGDRIEDHIACLVSDIEMPLMDGHRLTKLVKESPETKHIPVILFSSLISDEMRRKGEELGADAQITKPEIAELVNLIDKFII
ncbi:MAG: chemotaxis protein [Peptostreptococcaceae bacterium]